MSVETERTAAANLTVWQVTANFLAAFVGTVGTILAALAAYAAWAMRWPGAFVAAAGVGLVCYTLQWRAIYGNEQPFALRFFRALAKVGPWTAAAGAALSIIAGAWLWVGGFVVVGAIGIYLRIIFSR